MAVSLRSCGSSLLPALLPLLFRCECIEKKRGGGGIGRSFQKAGDAARQVHCRVLLLAGCCCIGRCQFSRASLFFLKKAALAAFTPQRISKSFLSSLPSASQTLAQSYSKCITAVHTPDPISRCNWIAGQGQHLQS